MLGLWIEQEPLVSQTRHRELALEVAALRLARWPAVQQIEAFLAGGEIAPPSASSRGSGSTASHGTQGSAPSEASGASALEAAATNGEPLGDSPVAAGSPGATLHAALAERRLQRLAAAVDRADCELAEDGSALHLTFAPEDRALAEHARAAQTELLAVATETIGVSRLELTVPEDTTLASDALRQHALSDTQVALVQRVIGGEVESVRPA
jgi:hypothetical protein